MSEELEEATRIAISIWSDHYADTAPGWDPLDDLLGVLSQIDNMVCGLSRAK